MTVAEQIAALERQAQAIGLTLKELCRRAGVRDSNVYRWKSGAVSPTEETWAETRALLEEALEEALGDVWAAIQRMQKEAL